MKKEKVERINAPVAQISPCPWNPRPEITPVSVADLAANMAAKGMLQDVGLVRRSDGGFWCIFGNRRLVAAKSLGWKSVAAKVYDCSEADARELTRIENECRRAVDPLKDAALVAEMVRLGFSGKEIAAHFGVSEPTVCRRMKLCSLTTEWREIAARGHGLTTHALELVASFPAEVQAACAKKFPRLDNAESPTAWGAVEWAFQAETRALDMAPWMAGDERFADLAERCRSCPNRSGAQPELFGDGDGEDSLGRCGNRKCFEEFAEEHDRRVVDAAVPANAEREIVEESWEFQRVEGAKKRSAKNPCAFVHVEGSRALVKWGPSVEERRKAEERRKLDEERKAEEREARAEVVRSAEKKLNEFSRAANWRLLVYDFVVGGDGEFRWDRAAQLLAAFQRFNSEWADEFAAIGRAAAAPSRDKFNAFWEAFETRISGVLGGWVSGDELAKCDLIFGVAEKAQLTPEEVKEIMGR